MSRRQVVAALVALVVLAAAVAWQRRPQERAADGPQMLVPEGTVAGTARLEIVREGREGEACTLVREGERWQVATRDDAPVEAEHLQRLLDAVDGLVGEQRAEDATLLPDFQLAGEGVTDLLFLGEDGSELLRLRVGKRGPRVNRSFVRIGDGDVAWLAHAGLHSALGIHGHGDRPFDPDFFIDLHLFGVEAEQVLGVATEGLSAWSIARAEPGLPWGWEPPVRSAGPPDEREATGKAHTVARSRAASLVGRVPMADHGLDAPVGRLTARTAEGAVTLRIGAVAQPDDDDDHAREERYVALDGDDLVWRMSRSAVDSLFRDVGSEI